MTEPIDEFKAMLNDYRTLIKGLETDVRRMLAHSDNAVPRPDKLAEVNANIMLSVRHLEDARMRLGKAIQYADDCVSIYDKQFFNKE